MVAGMFLLRRPILEKEFASNPRLNIEAVRTLLGASGQRPKRSKSSPKSIAQIVRTNKNQQWRKQEKNKSGANLNDNKWEGLGGIS